jgi:hypothetical protein
MEQTMGTRMGNVLPRKAVMLEPQKAIESGVYLAEWLIGEESEFEWMAVPMAKRKDNQLDE